MNPEGALYKWVESKLDWTHIEAPNLKMISISSDNKIAGIDNDNDILLSTLDDLTNWHKIPGDFQYVDISKDYIVATQ